MPAIPRPRRARCKLLPAVQPLEPRTLFAAGGLDPTFGSGGIVTTDTPDSTQSSSNERVAHLALQPDGKILAVGSIIDSSSGFHGAVLVRYNPDGSVDTSFASQSATPGRVNISGALFSNPDLAYLPNGQVLVALQSGAPATDVTVLRFNSDGTPDPAFGANGAAAVDLGNDGVQDVLVRLLVRSDGDAYLVGNGNVDSLTEASVTLIDTLGNPVPTFGTNGSFHSNGGEADISVSDAAIQGDHLLLAGQFNEPVDQTQSGELLRVTADGRPDSSFGTFGAAMSAPGPSVAFSGVSVFTDGRIAVVGFQNNNPLYAVYSVNGAPDNSFDGNGAFIDTNRAAFGRRVLALPSGDLLALSQNQSDSSFSFDLLRPDGTPDPDFPSNGIEPDPSAGELATLLRQPDGRVLAAGGADDASVDFLLERLLAPDVSSNLLANGSFEVGPYTYNADHAQDLGPGDTTIAGWTVINDHLAVITTPSPTLDIPAQNGVTALDLTSYDDAAPYGGVQQTVTTVPGTAYTLSFFAGPSAAVNGRTVTIRASAGAASQDFTATANTPAQVDWTPFTLTFTATAATTTISLLGIASTGTYLGLDSVSLVPADTTGASVNFSLDSLTTTDALVAGSTARVTVLASNSGAAPSSADLNLYLSADATAGNADDILIGHLPATSIAAGATGFTLGTATVTLPASLPTGDYHLVALIDPGNAVPETDESDNGLATSQTFPVTSNAGSPLPDLTINTVAASATTATAGDALQYGFSVENVGAAASPNVGLDIYLSSTPDFTTGNPTRIDHTTLGLINPGGFDNGAMSVTLPANLAPGQYYLAAYVDPDNSVAESNENNNIAFQTAPLTITSGTGGGTTTVIPKTGSLDLSFGNGTGIVTNTLAGPPITLAAALTQPDGKLLSAGFDSAGNFTLTRNNPDGSLDTSFATTGTARIPVAPGAVATAAALQPNGQILLAGYGAAAPASAGRSDNDFILLRLNPDGSLDTSFANNGTLLLDLASLRGDANSTDILQSLALLKSGQILLAGTTTAVAASAATNPTDAAIVRLSSNGAVDPSFAQAGLATLDFLGGPDALNSLLIQSDNKILVLGSATKPNGPTFAAVARLTPTGQRDNKFAAKGLFTSPVPGDQLTSAAFGLKGAIYLGGFNSTSDPTSPSFTATPVILRLNAKGKLDSAFKKGRVTPAGIGAPIAAVNQLISTPDGRVTASVTTANSLADLLAARLGAVLLRLTTTGTPDPTFNTTGLLTLLTPPAAPNAPAAPATLSTLIAALSTNLADAFSALIGDTQAAITTTPGGGIRAIAITPAGANSTTQKILAITPDAPDLAATLAAIPNTLTAGKKSSATLNLTNAGSLPAKATVTVQLYLSTDPTLSGDDVLVGTLKLKTKLNPLAKAKPAKLSFTPARTVPTNTYYLIARVNPANFPLKELTPDNNTPASPNPTTLTTAPARNKLKPTHSLFSPTPVLANP